MTSASSSTLDPLLVLPGARFACQGDGLCCTDVHSVGPLTATERETLQVIDPRLVASTSEGYDVLLHNEEGRCFFLRSEGCFLHTRLGPQAKPGACTRYPLRLTATPTGGRISTAHACPCRTLGPRPELTAEQARTCLLDARDELEPELHVEGPIPMQGEHTASFADYAAHESKLLQDLATLPAEQALGVSPLPPVGPESYAKVATEFLQAEAHNRFETACQWFSVALLRLLNEGERDWPARPWADAFQRAETRSTADDQPDGIYAQWLSDHLWSLLWTRFGTLQSTRLELASLLAIARVIAAELVAQGQSPALAAAESVTIVELAGDSDPWRQLCKQMDPVTAR